MRSLLHHIVNGTKYISTSFYVLITSKSKVDREKWKFYKVNEKSQELATICCSRPHYVRARTDYDTQQCGELSFRNHGDG